jgi:DNA-binding MarR family transcriptional regulator
VTGKSESRLPISHALIRYVEQRAAASAEARRRLGINEVDAKTLLHVQGHPGIRPTQLREHLGITSAGVTTLADRLIGRGMLRREQDADDRRVNHLYVEVDLSSEPWSVLTAFDDALDRELRERLPDARDEFAAALTSAVDATEKVLAGD